MLSVDVDNSSTLSDVSFAQIMTTSRHSVPTRAAAAEIVRKLANIQLHVVQCDFLMMVTAQLIEISPHKTTPSASNLEIVNINHPTQWLE
jgi:hypothetical protein